MKRLTISVSACTETMGLLVAVAWADGRLDDREKEGVRGAAQVLNLGRDFRARIDQMLATPSTIDQVDLGKLTVRDRAFAFVAAAWMAHTDAELAPAEVDLLERIGAKAGFSKERQQELVGIARGLHPLPAGVASWSEQITTLFRAIPPQLEEPGDDFEVVFE